MIRKFTLLIIALLCIVISGCGTSDKKYLAITPEEFMNTYNKKLDSFEQNYDKYKISIIQKPLEGDDIGNFVFNNNDMVGNYVTANDSQSVRQIGFLVLINNDEMKLNIFKALAEAATQNTKVSNADDIIDDLIAKNETSNIISKGIQFDLTYNENGKPIDLQICDDAYSKMSETK